MADITAYGCGTAQADIFDNRARIILEDAGGCEIALAHLDMQMLCEIQDCVARAKQKLMDFDAERDKRNPGFAARRNDAAT